MSASLNPVEPLLSREESDALLDAMRSGESTRQLEGADLGSPDRRLKESLGKADKCGQAFARTLRPIILRVAGCAATSEDQPAEIAPYDVLRSSISPGAGMASVIAPDGSRGIMVVGPALVAFVLGRRLGAPLQLEETEAGAPPPRSALSAVERRLMAPLLDELIQTFSELWCGDRNTLRIEVAARLEDLPELGQFEPLLRIGARAVPAGAAGDEILVALTAGMVRATMPDAHEEHTQVKPISTSDRRLMADRVSATEVELVAVLGQISSTIGHVLSLSAGDVVRLESIPGQPVPVRVDTHVVMRGTPVVHHGNLAIEVIGPADARPNR